jgi:hypothetical protein
MTQDGPSIAHLIENELVAFADEDIIGFIRKHLIEPAPIMLGWDYGSPVEALVRGWSVFEDPIAGTRIVYCLHGFGPASPWGLVSLKEQIPRMGMDSGWFTCFLDAFFDSFSSSRLPIYQVVMINPDRTQTFLSAEGEFDDAWAQVEKLRSAGETPILDLSKLRHSHPIYNVITPRYPRS